MICHVNFHLQGCLVTSLLWDNFRQHSLRSSCRWFYCWRRWRWQRGPPCVRRNTSSWSDDSSANIATTFPGDVLKRVIPFSAEAKVCRTHQMVLLSTAGWTEAIDKVNVLLKDVMQSCNDIERGPASWLVRPAHSPLQHSPYLRLPNIRARYFPGIMRHFQYLFGHSAALRALRHHRY